LNKAVWIAKKVVRVPVPDDHGKGATVFPPHEV
jgi:hypothetical protein